MADRNLTDRNAPGGLCDRARVADVSCRHGPPDGARPTLPWCPYLAANLAAPGCAGAYSGHAVAHRRRGSLWSGTHPAERATGVGRLSGEAAPRANDGIAIE